MSSGSGKRRTGLASGLAVVMVAVGLATSTSPALSAPDPAIRGAGSSEAIPGSYIVVLKEKLSLSKAGVDTRAQSLARAHRGTVKSVYEKSFQGFSVAMSEDEAKRLAADPDVDFVEQDQTWHLADTQEQPPSWGLDRIDQRALPLDTVYSYEPIRSTVTAYVIDTGVRISHAEFGGRASDGRDLVSGDGVAEDCHGHGTHVAGTIGGTTYGVAKNVRIVAVRVFDCRGTATSTSIQDGIEWVINNGTKPAVINMSIGINCRDASGNPRPCDAGTGSAIKVAMRRAVVAGFHFVVSAGNSNISACGQPTAQVTGTIVVGASRANDTKPMYSNWGACLDLWAPGGDDPPVNGCVPIPTAGYLGIISAGIASDTALCQMSGTSMAAPHVAGAVAMILSRPGWALKTPDEVRVQVTNEAAANVMTGLDAGSPNKLLHVSPPPVAGGSSIALARHSSGLLELFGVSTAGTLFRRTQQTVNSISWLGATASIDPNWYSVCAQTDNAPAIVLAGLHRGRTAWHRRQAFVNGDSWTSWQDFRKELISCGAALDSGGKLEFFGADPQGKIYRATQVSPSGAAFTPLTDLGLAQVTRGVAAERNGNNQVEVFALNRNGQIWHCWQTASNCTGANGWVQLDGLLSTIAVARNASGNLAVFGVNAGGQLFQRHALAGVNIWPVWSPMVLPAAVGTPRSVAAEANANGLIALIMVNTAGQVWQSIQMAANGQAFSPWTQIDGLLRP